MISSSENLSRVRKHFWCGTHTNVVSLLLFSRLDARAGNASTAVTVARAGITSAMAQGTSDEDIEQCLSCVEAMMDDWRHQVVAQFKRFVEAQHKRMH